MLELGLKCLYVNFETYSRLSFSTRVTTRRMFINSFINAFQGVFVDIVS